MINGLQTLIQLQEVQLSIREQEDCLKRVPAQIESLREQLTDLEQELERAQASVEEQRKRRRLVEGEVESIKIKLSHFRDQLMAVKTNKEYQAVLKEITLAEQEISKNEDRILELMLNIDEKNERLAEVQRRIDEKQKELGEQRVGLEAEAATAEKKITSLNEELDILIAQVPDALRALYDRIAAARNGRAMAEVRDDSCQVCHVRLRPQLSTELKTNTKKILTCESCNRILYFRKAPVAEKPASS